MRRINVRRKADYFSGNRRLRFQLKTNKSQQVYFSGTTFELTNFRDQFVKKNYIWKNGCELSEEL